MVVLGGDGMWSMMRRAEGYRNARSIFSHLSQARVIWEEGASIEKIPSSDFRQAGLGGHFLD